MTTTVAENPLVEGLERLPVHPTTLVIFGGTGDLAKRKLLPAIYNLAHEGALPERFNLIGVSRSEMSDDAYRELARESITQFSRRQADPQVLDSLLGRIRYVGGTFDDASVYERLETCALEYDDEAGIAFNRVFYLSTAPSFFPVIVGELGSHGLDRREDAEVRVVIEKPFGTNLDEARQLNRDVLEVLDESQVYRIDHFLGKEATQDLHVLRFANEVFSAMWDRDHIESVQIDVPETLGVDDRAGFYDATGAVLDMLVTHLFQVAAEVAMEIPATLGAADLQAAREKVIRCFRPLDPAEVVLGQFTGYREVPGVATRSKTDTFVAARLWIDNPRWHGVPFLLRTGKRMAASEQRVTLVLRTPPHPFTDLPPQANLLSFSLSGSGEIDLRLLAKQPGVGLNVEPATARLPLSQLQDAAPLPPYVRLIHDVLLGDRSLFTRPDGLSAVWKVAQPLLDNPPRLAPYAQDSWGPARARHLPAPQRWLLGD
jgi:glucose-6-phosphate 1-dehydrogenase